MSERTNHGFEGRIRRVAENRPPEQRAGYALDVEEMIAAGATTLANLHKLLWSGPEELREKACDAIGRLGDRRSTAVVLSALLIYGTGNELVRSLGWALGMLKDERSVEPLLAALGSRTEVCVRESIAYALGWIHDNRAVKPLMTILRDQRESPLVREQAAESLGLLGDMDAVEALIDALTDPDASVRFWSAYALGELHDMRAIEPLQRLMSDAAEVPHFATIGDEARSAIELILLFSARAKGEGDRCG